MPNNRPVDKTKKSNIKCEHCKHWDEPMSDCKLTNKFKWYYNRCKQFEWGEKYKGEKQE